MSKRKFTKNDILQAIQNLARLKGRNWLGRKEFVRETGISEYYVYKYFDNWNDAIKEAGLKPMDKNFRPFAKSYSKEDILKKMREIAKKLERNYLSRSEFTKETGIQWRTIRKLFANWEQAVKEAGLNIHPSHRIKIPEVELFQECLRIADVLNRFPSYREFARRSKYSVQVCQDRFGTFTEFRKRAIQYGLDKGLIKPQMAQPAIDKIRIKSTHKEASYGAFTDRPVLGEKIDFQGLLHAPVNELGVVYLFGILSDDLDFVVESFQSGFPDCEAKRRIKNKRWQRVRIEFEYISSNFIDHGHDITKCDIIICWEHDWDDCPLEVISLKEYIKTTRK